MLNQKKVTLDTNCFIDAFDSGSSTYGSMQKILKASCDKLISITVSRHTLSEIQHPKEAMDFVKICEILPHFPIGTWSEQIAAWNEVAGTWNDARRNQELQEELEKLANSGNDIRDRGAYIDAIISGADAFITSDRDLVRSRPAERIKKRFGLRVITPQQFVDELNL